MPSQILIIDIEATCWENNRAYQEEHSEIIEIGLCFLDSQNSEVYNQRSILVKPYASEITPYCTQLTTLTQEMIQENGVELSQACAILQDEFHSLEYTWASYGDYDKFFLSAQCAKHGINFPLSKEHINVKKQLANLLGKKKEIGMKKALQTLGISFEGTHHRGVDDAYNIARILSWTLRGNTR